jgi:hypothetical protein
MLLCHMAHGIPHLQWLVYNFYIASPKLATQLSSAWYFLLALSTPSHGKPRQLLSQSPWFTVHLRLLSPTVGLYLYSIIKNVPHGT